MESKKSYRVNNITLKSIGRRNCALLFSDPEYEPATWRDLRDLMQVMEWEGAVVAQMVGVSGGSKAGSRTVRRWTADPSETDSARQIPYAAWRLLLINAELVTR